MYEHVSVYVCTCIPLHVCMCVHLCICGWICEYMYMCIFMGGRVCVAKWGKIEKLNDFPKTTCQVPHPVW